MLRLSLRNALDHKVRFLLTTLAVVMGVGFVVGSFVVTDSLQASIDQLFKDITAGVDVSVRAETNLDSGQAPAARGRVPADLVDDDPPGGGCRRRGGLVRWVRAARRPRGRAAHDHRRPVHRRVVGPRGPAAPGDPRRGSGARRPRRGRDRPGHGGRLRLLRRRPHHGPAGRRHAARGRDRRDLHLRRGEQPPRCPPDRVRRRRRRRGVRHRRRGGQHRHRGRRRRVAPSDLAARVQRVLPDGIESVTGTEVAAEGRGGHRWLHGRLPEHPAGLRGRRAVRVGLLHQQHLLDRRRPADPPARPAPRRRRQRRSDHPLGRGRGPRRRGPGVRRRDRRSGC